MSGRSRATLLGDGQAHPRLRACRCADPFRPWPAQQWWRTGRNRRGLEQHEVAVDEHRDAAGRIEPEVLGALVRILIAIDQRQFVGRADLLEQHVGREVRIAREVVEFVHVKAGDGRRPQCSRSGYTTNPGGAR